MKYIYLLSWSTNISVLTVSTNVQAYPIITPKTHKDFFSLKRLKNTTKAVRLKEKKMETTMDVVENITNMNYPILMLYISFRKQNS